MFWATLSGCAGDRAHREGLDLAAAGKGEAALAQLETAVQQAPDNLRFRADLITQREALVSRSLNAGDTARSQGHWDDAEARYQEALKLAADNVRAQQGLLAVTRGRRFAGILDEARAAHQKNDLELAQALTRMVLGEQKDYPEALALQHQLEEARLKDALAEPLSSSLPKQPVNLEFRDAPLKKVLEALSKSYNLNFLLDKDVPPDLRITVFLRQTSIDEALNLILETNQLNRKLLNANTVFVFPGNAEKQKTHAELMVKGFYLANADVKEVQAALQGLLKIKDLIVDEKLNLVVVRDTPEAIRLAEKTIALLDLEQPEVMLEVEVLEVTRSRLLDLGVKFPTQVTLSPLTSGSTPLTLQGLFNLDPRKLEAKIDNAELRMLEKVGDVRILANPRIRSRDREKANILIGDKLPVVTSTSSSTGFVSENIQYLDVGIKLDVEPRIYLHGEVAIKVALEVSSISQVVKTAAGGTAYQVGTRTASTILRLKDGESQVLGGLIDDQTRTAANRLPGLGDLPILGRLFSSQSDDNQKKEIVLSITPRIVRQLDRPAASARQFWSGTESTLRTQPLRLRAAAELPVTGKSVNGAVQAKNDAPGEHKEASSALSFTWQGPNQAKVGELIKLGLRIKTEQDLRSLPLQIGFDPQVFQIAQINEGEFFKQDDGQTSFSSHVDPAGKLMISPVRAGTEGIQGEGEIAHLMVRILAAKPKAEIRLLNVVPITAEGKPTSPILPAPYLIDAHD